MAHPVSTTPARKAYPARPTLRLVEMTGGYQAVVTPSVHDTIGDDEIYTRRHAWWEDETEEEEEEG